MIPQRSAPDCSVSLLGQIFTQPFPLRPERRPATVQSDELLQRQRTSFRRTLTHSFLSHRNNGRIFPACKDMPFQIFQYSIRSFTEKWRQPPEHRKNFPGNKQNFLNGISVSLILKDSHEIVNTNRRISSQCPFRCRAELGLSPLRNVRRQAHTKKTGESCRRTLASAALSCLMHLISNHSVI